jgi:O-antigen ligase
MPNVLFTPLKKIYFKNKLKFLELIFLSLFLAFLPSFEAPKNIFLLSYLVTALYRQSQLPSIKWSLWDWVFLSLILSSFITALFPGISGGYEWKGFRGMLIWIIFGWTLSRSDYIFDEKKYFFIFAIIATLPALAWGLIDFLLSHSKNNLELHSVGHVNHSAIYLCMIVGATFALLIDQLHYIKMKNVFIGCILSSVLFSSVVLTQSRGAFGIIILLVLALFLFSKLSIKIKVTSVALISILLIAIIFIKPVEVVKKQITNQADHNVLAYRDNVWRASFEIAKFNLLLGIGNGNWRLINPDQIKTAVESRGETFDEKDFALHWGHAHNIYLSNLVDRGILGLIIFLNFSFIWLITLINSYKKYNQDPRAMLFIMGSFSAWTTIFGIGFVNTTFHHENALLALFFLALHLSYLRQKNQLKLFS